MTGQITKLAGNLLPSLCLLVARIEFHTFIVQELYIVLNELQQYLFIQNGYRRGTRSRGRFDTGSHDDNS